jgi:hypothetical protein
MIFNDRPWGVIKTLRVLAHPREIRRDRMKPRRLGKSHALVSDDVEKGATSKRR